MQEPEIAVQTTLTLSEARILRLTAVDRLKGWLDDAIMNSGHLPTRLRCAETGCEWCIEEVRTQTPGTYRRIARGLPNYHEPEF